MVARSDAGPIGRSLRLRQYLARIDSFLIVLVLAALQLWANAQLRSFVHWFLPAQAAFDQQRSKIEFEYDNGEQTSPSLKFIPDPFEIRIVFRQVAK
jgi:hypothetical protein